MAAIRIRLSLSLTLTTFENILRSSDSVQRIKVIQYRIIMHPRRCDDEQVPNGMSAWYGPIGFEEYHPRHVQKPAHLQFRHTRKIVLKETTDQETTITTQPFTSAIIRREGPSPMTR